ncbi:MAG: hypothetical protein KME15_02460 [Drouetiella hepatica Uher 2000/2452]|uniref:Uncharacterized protein n=1 Tax=Drouetiella hepatica Uher 2000/2452 TaxID=904376 RepID=A0A951Q8Q8_9CYAN|nr:hypothetical protein [Drouetiella hepatica Uher 2000/2452]
MGRFAPHQNVPVLAALAVAIDERCDRQSEEIHDKLTLQSYRARDF